MKAVVDMWDGDAQYDAQGDLKSGSSVEMLIQFKERPYYAGFGDITSSEGAGVIWSTD